MLFKKFTAAAAATLTMAGTWCACAAEDPPPPPKKLLGVEEDHVVLVENPDAKIAAPQIVVMCEPDTTTGGEYALFTLNHATEPSFFAGGVQLQTYQGEVLTGMRNSPKTQVLSHGYDRIKFTTTMKLTGDGHIEFGLKGGSSRTWGNFGNDKDQPIAVRVKTNHTDLSNYDRNHTLKNTVVSHGAHRVTIMYQRRVRYYWSDGSTTVDGAYKILHRFQSVIQDMTLEQWEQSKTEYNYEDVNE